MENGEGNLESKFARLTVTDPYNINGNDGLFQVMKAVEAAEATIKQQAAKQERLTFVSSLMPLLAEYSLQPPVADAQSIVSNVKIGVGGSLYKVVQDTKEKELKVLRNLEFCLVLDISGNVLFRHLQEQLLVTEGKLKESQYQLGPWRSDVNPSNFAQSPVYPIEIKNGLELVPQPTYSDGKMPSSDRQTSMVEDILGLPQSGRENLKNFEHDELERHPPLASRNIALDEVPSQLVFSQAEQHTIRNNEGTVGKKVTFGDLVRSSEIDEPENRGHPSDREPSANWNSKASATTTMDDPNSSYSPYLPPVLEEPSSSFSEAADDDPLPAIEGLQISGEAFRDSNSKHVCSGTALEDGSFNYVDVVAKATKLSCYLGWDVDGILPIEYSHWMIGERLKVRRLGDLKVYVSRAALDVARRASAWPTDGLCPSLLRLARKLDWLWFYLSLPQT
ncbi:UNVERIFIED_CONTAM: hypothetical protein Sangu_2931000 [Sesamum angustifolium]|uniref:Uncharacterized protein n=1 Tax=Sesamum angustifolium TaxID=2727405 RepID=A0AAW2IKB6_9LAMI